MRLPSLARFIVLVLATVITACGGDGSKRPVPPPTPTVAPPPGSVTLETFDANVTFTLGVFLPLQEYTESSVTILTLPLWTTAARPIRQVAADGVTMLLLRVKMPLQSAGAATFRLDSGGRPSGGLFAVDDDSVVDTSPDGGTIDNAPTGATSLTVPSIAVGDASYAFALYRAPRNFDVDVSTDLRNFSVDLNVDVAGVMARAAITVVRPLIVFVHGTGGDNSNWDLFSLWRTSANELTGFEFQTGGLPFYADRISYQWIDVAAGPLAASGQTILIQLTRSLLNWRIATGTAGTQVEVVTHSYGGPVARQATQTQFDSDPLAHDDQHNFRAASNWGHGLIHKLITLAGSHRGSAVANTAAVANGMGTLNDMPAPGQVRLTLCNDSLDIAAGAFADQLVLSPALRALRETRIPGHAFVGSGLVQNEPAPMPTPPNTPVYSIGSYHGEYWAYQCLDPEGGPYRAAGLVAPMTNCVLVAFFIGPSPPFDTCAYNRLVNYVFNLEYDVPPLKPKSEDPNCAPIDGPNYDLTLSALSTQAMMPDEATTTALDLDPTGSLVGHLNHGQLLTVPQVADAVTALMHEPTTSDVFAHFPAAGELTELEQRLSNVGSAEGLAAGVPCTGPPTGLVNSCFSPCPAPDQNTSCFEELGAFPPTLVIRGFNDPAPIFVYGKVMGGVFDGGVIHIQSLAYDVWCTVTMTSADPTIAKIVVQQPSLIPVVQGVSVGRTTVTITVQNNPMAKIEVPVIVEPLLLP